MGDDKREPMAGVELEEERHRELAREERYRHGDSYQVAVPKTGQEVDLFTTDQQGPATGLDVIITPGPQPDLVQDAIVRVYAEVSGAMVLCPESIRSVRDVTQKTRVTLVRNRVAQRFKATIQARVRADPRPDPIVNVMYSLTGREAHPDDNEDATEWTPDSGITGNTGVLLVGAGACMQAYFVNNSGVDTFVMLFKAPTFAPLAPNPGNPFFAVLPCGGSGGWCSFDFVRKGQRYLNGVTFGCSSDPAVYTPDLASVTGFAEGE